MKNSNWPSELLKYIKTQQSQVFVWGSIDCCTFGSGAVKAMTGSDPMQKYRYTYNSAIGAIKSLRRFGHYTLCSAVDEALGPSNRVSSKFVQRGDILVLRSSEALQLTEGWEEAVAVSLGSQIAVRTNKVVLMPVASLNIIQAWRV